MRRRDFISLLGGAAAAWPRAAGAQQRRLRRIGMLMGMRENDPEATARIGAFLQTLEELGWVNGRNVQIEYSWPSEPHLIRAMTLEMVGRAPDVIVAHSTPVLAELHRQTQTIPIVFLVVVDPVGGGFVANLARPGRNITGFTSFEDTISGKWLDLLREMIPRMLRVGVLRNPAAASSTYISRAMEYAATTHGISLIPAGVEVAADIDKAFEEFLRKSVNGFVVMPDPITLAHRKQIVEQANLSRLPAVYPFTYFPKDGGLMSYGPDPIDIFRRAAPYVDRILKGGSPADLPIQQPTEFELVINLKTARALGISIPLTLQAAATEVIE